MSETVSRPATAAPTPHSCVEGRPDLSSASAAARSCGGRVEVLGQRTETTQVWARPEGGFSTEIYGGPVRFRKDGGWRAVDLTLHTTADGAVEPAGHPRGLRFSGAATGSGERVLARVETGGDSVSMLWTGPLPAPVLAANTATYREVVPGADLLLTATRLGFEQSLIVKDRAAAARVGSMSLPLRSDKLRFVPDGAASYAIRDAAGTTVGRVPTPMMWDSSLGASGERAREKALTNAGKPTASTGRLDLRLVADQAWLQDPKTKYPVTLDPQVELDPTSDTIVRNDELSTGGKPDHSGADYLAYGKATSYLARSFMQWPSAQLSGARISSATLSLWNWYSGSCSQTGWLVWNTAPYTNPIYWDTAPALLTNDGYSTQTAGFSSACNDAWVSASVVPLFQRAADAGKPTVFMGLTSYNETNPTLSWKQVRSLQAPNTAQIPVVRINYDYPPQTSFYRYGVNYPYGVAAVDYAYSPDEGLWRDLNNLKYGPNYYSDYLIPGKFHEVLDPPHDPSKELLIDLAAPEDARYTAYDANHHLLMDYDRNGVLDQPTAGFAFFENNARGKNGRRPESTPDKPGFHQFWFDDNWLSRHMAQAYGRQQPNGLSDTGDFVRWRILSGDPNWTPYDKPELGIPSDSADRLALDGLYYLTAGQQPKAMDKWFELLTKSGGTWNSATRLFTYPGLTENYHIGLFKLLTEQILAHYNALTAVDQRVLASHAVSLRAALIRNQQRLDGNGPLLGWTTAVDLTKEENKTSVQNIESIAVNALALGAAAKQVYSPGQAPLQAQANNYQLTADGLLQAIPGTSTPGHMTFGPNQAYAPGTYTVEFVLRSKNPISGTQVANLDVYDARSGAILGQRIVTADELVNDGTSDRFVRFTVPITVSAADNSLEFRTWWYGGSNPLEIAEIRVR